MIFRNKPMNTDFPAGFHTAYLGDEQQYVSERLADATLPPSVKKTIEDTARNLINDIRKNCTKKSGLDAFMAE